MSRTLRHTRVARHLSRFVRPRRLVSAMPLDPGEIEELRRVVDLRFGDLEDDVAESQTGTDTFPQNRGRLGLPPPLPLFLRAMRAR